jgi:hypothetical protein
MPFHRLLYIILLKQLFHKLLYYYNIMAGKKSKSKNNVMRKANTTLKSFSKAKMKKFLPSDAELKNKLLRYRMRVGL